MAVSISKTNEEIQQLPLVELACEILKVKREPFYFRDLMNEIQELRGLSEKEVMDVIARLYTEINIDGRFVCIGQNVWGLKRWYPVDKTTEKASSSKKFVRASGDAFSDDDELDDYDDEDDVVMDDVDDELDANGDADLDAEESFDSVHEEEDGDYSDDDDEEDSEAELEDDFTEEESEDADEDEEEQF